MKTTVLTQLIAGALCVASCAASADIALRLTPTQNNSERVMHLPQNGRLLFKGEIENIQSNDYQWIDYGFELAKPDGTVAKLGRTAQVNVAPNETILPYKTHIDLAALNLPQSCYAYTLSLKTTDYDFEHDDFDYVNHKIGKTKAASIVFKVGDQSSCPMLGAPKKMLIVRGTNASGNCVPANVGNGNSPKVGVKEELTNLSVSCGDASKVTIAQLKSPLPNAYACKSDLITLRGKSKTVTVVPDPTSGNRYHCLLGGITPNQFVAGSKSAD